VGGSRPVHHPDLHIVGRQDHLLQRQRPHHRFGQPCHAHLEQGNLDLAGEETIWLKPVLTEPVF